MDNKTRHIMAQSFYSLSAICLGIFFITSYTYAVVAAFYGLLIAMVYRNEYIFNELRRQ